MSSKRLEPTGLPGLPQHIQQPRFDRTTLGAGIVHLGIGAFARAHLLAFNDDALDAAAPNAADWGVVGVSLRQCDTRDALAPQQGLYTLSLRDADGLGVARDALRVIGSLAEVLVAPDDPAAVLERIASPAARIVSLTVTEKGYCREPSGAGLHLAHPDIANDLAHPDSPRSAIGFIVRGLALRRARGLGGVSLLSLDNLPANGRVLRALVQDFVEQIDDAGLADWIDGHCSFPCSMVDRIVPRTTGVDRERIARQLGQHDAWPVVAEPFIDWVLEDHFVAGRPDWPGVRWAADAAEVAKAERLKLRMVNGAHSAIAYLGVVAGWSTVDVAIAEPALRGFIDTMLKHEVEPTLAAGSLPMGYRERLLQRFANPALAHRCAQIAMDGSQKMPQRLLGTLRDRLEAGQPINQLTLAVAAWLHFLRGHDEAGTAYDIDDPEAGALQQVHREAEALLDPQARAEHFVRSIAAFGDLTDAPGFITAFATALHSLREQGVRGALASTSSPPQSAEQRLTP